MPLLPIVQQIMVDGTWVDATPHVRGGNVSSIHIQRGFTGEQQSNSVGICNFVLNNRDGLWSNRNPNSPYFGQVGRNVQVRTGLETGLTSLRMLDSNTFGTSDYDGACALTADKAVLDITGDIDIRIDCEPDHWRGRKGQIFGGKYTLAGDQRSYAFFSDPYGYLHFFTSSAGTSGTRVMAKSTDVIGPNAGRISIRVTRDVDNGAAGNTTTFYTGTGGVTGSWTQLGSPVVIAGTTTIFNSSSNLIAGNVNSSAGRGSTFGPGLESDPFTGKIYRFQVLNGIAGTVVADMNATAQAAGTTLWSDGLGTPNTWTLQSSAEISSMDWRFHGELSTGITDWDNTGTDVIVNVQAGDLRQRLSQGQPVFRSPIFRNISRRLTDIDGWWPMEDGFGSSAIGAQYGARGGFNNAAFGSATDFPGTAGVLAFNDDAGFAYGNCTISPTTTGTTTHMCYLKMPAVPPSATNLMFMQGFYTGGNVARATLESNNIAYAVTIYSNTGAVLVSNSFLHGSGAAPNRYLAIRLRMVQNGGNVDWALAWYPKGAAVLYGGSGSFAGTIGRPRGWNSPPYTGKSGLELAHVLMSRADPGFESSDFTSSTNAYVSERAFSRARRLADEEDLSLYQIGLYQIDGADVTQPMGPQGLRTGLELLQECADAVGGLFYSPRDKYGLTMRTHESLTNQAGPTFSYPDSHFSGRLVPEDGDFGVRNDVTASRPDGSGSGRFTKLTGPMNTSDPRDDPEGIGVAPGSVSVNAWPDSALDEFAAFDVHLGTWDEPRYTNVQWELHRAPYVADPALAAAAKTLDLGDRFDIEDVPVWVGAGSAAVIFRGYAETLQNMTHTIVANTAPYGPYLVNDFTLTDESHFVIADDGLTTLVESVPSVAVDRGGFENPAGVSNWSGNNVTIAQSSAQARTGTYSMLCTVQSTGVDSYARPYAAAVPVSVGISYGVRVWVRSPHTLTVFAAIDYVDAGFGYIGGAYGTPTVLVANTWTALSVSGPAPALSTQAVYGATATAASVTAGNTFYLDDVALWSNPAAPGLDAYTTNFVVDTDMSGLGLPWTTGSHTDVFLMVGGERMQLNAVGSASVVGGAWRQTLATTRSIDGIVKAHPAGAKVASADPFYLDL